MVDLSYFLSLFYAKEELTFFFFCLPVVTPLPGNEPRSRWRFVSGEFGGSLAQ